MRVKIDTWQLQNVVKTATGLRTRKGLQSVKTPTSGTVYVASFSVESPSTSEVFHYLFEQATATGVCTLRVYTEEFLELFSVGLGVLQRDPVITWGVSDNQLMINSPSFASPLYGVVGGGLISAVKQDSVNPDTTALDIPSGHICMFGDRPAIAEGPVLFVADPGVTAKRTFVAVNAFSFAGNIYDHFQGPDGALHLFTSSGLFTMPADALGQGQAVSGFISRVPGIETSRPRNAISTGGRVVFLQRDGVQILGGEKLDLTTFDGRRYFSTPMDVEDLRQVGELYATPTGFIVGFRGKRGHYADVNLLDGTICWVTASAALNVVGVLKSRDGDTLIVLKNRIVLPYGNADFTGTAIRGVVSGKLDLPENDRPIIRRVTLSSANASQAVGVAIDGTAKTDTAPTKTEDVIIGTTAWSSTTKLHGRVARTVRHSFNERVTDPSIEICVDGGDRKVEANIDIEVNGVGRTRRDSQ